MVQLQPSEGEDDSMNLAEAGDMLVDLHHDHSEAFLFYKVQDPKRTDGVARAMADIDVDLKRAEVDWEIAKRALDQQGQEFEIRRIELLLRRTPNHDSTTTRPQDRGIEPDPRTDQEREGPTDPTLY